MSTSRDIQQQIYEAQNRRRAAEYAEMQRQQNEQQHQSAIANADADIRQLEAQQAAVRWLEDVEHNRDLVEANKQATFALMTSLNMVAEAFKRAIERKPADVIDTFNKQQQHADDAINRQKAHIAATTPESEVTIAIRHAVEKGYSQLPNANMLETVLSAWIVQAKTDQERKLRVGIAYPIIGYAIELDDNFDADLANTERIASRRRQSGESS